MIPHSRRGWLKTIVSFGALAAVGAAAYPAQARRRRTQVKWSAVTLPEDPRRTKREALLRKILVEESRRADWGKHDDGVEASIRVAEFHVTHRKDVVRVTCTALGKLHKGPSVRTHFSYGDHPSRQDELERTVLTLVARGVVTRLASIARARALKAQKT